VINPSCLPDAISLESFDNNFEHNGTTKLHFTSRKGVKFGDVIYWYYQINKNSPTEQKNAFFVGWLEKPRGFNEDYIVLGNLTDNYFIDQVKEFGINIFREYYGNWGLNLTPLRWCLRREQDKYKQMGAMPLSEMWKGRGNVILDPFYRKLWGKKKGDGMKNVWEVIVIDKEKDKIITQEIVIDGDEKSACSKISIAFATKLKAIAFKNLVYITKNLGSYE